MCLWPVSKVLLEDPPPKKKKKKKTKEKKKKKKGEEEPKPNYILADERLHLQPFHNAEVSGIISSGSVTMSNNPWTNPTHPTAIAAMNRSHQRVYVPVTQNAQQPPASNNPWACHQPTPQAWAPYPSCYPMVIPTVVPAVIPCGFPPMQYPGNSPTSPPVQFYSAQVQSPGGANYYQGQTSAQVNANNQARAHHVGAYNSNVQMVPQPASPNDQYWCRELTGHYTLRTVNTIMQSLQPGVWTRASSGYPLFVRHAKS